MLPQAKGEYGKKAQNGDKKGHQVTISDKMLNTLAENGTGNWDFAYRW
jgi:hypothetical protein